MGVMEKTKFWRRMRKAVDTDVGAKIYEATGGLLNKVGGLATPRFSGEIPWAPLRKTLADSTLTAISTAGFHLDSDPPFDVDSAEGDPSYRAIAADCEPERLRIAHAHYPNRYARADRNVLLPVDRLQELAEAGVFKLAERLFSFGFGGTLTSAYIKEPDGTAHQLARELQQDGVDLALLVPA